jgi:hypothetical protein
MTVKVFTFEVAVDRNDVRFTIYDTAQSYNLRNLKQLASLIIGKHFHHVRIASEEKFKRQSSKLRNFTRETRNSRTRISVSKRERYFAGLWTFPQRLRNVTQQKASPRHNLREYAPRPCGMTFALPPLGHGQPQLMGC